jgi:AcrR family transcriptional regulator
MSRVEGTPERQRLMGLVVDLILRDGVIDTSLSAIARAIGSNNRMLLYYFGSKEQLIADALDVVMSRYPGIVSVLDALDQHDVPLADRLDAAWHGLAAEPVPMRLFFEVFGLAAHHPGRFDSYLHVVGAVWIDRVTMALRGDGVPSAEARLLGREIVALWRGLQFDLVSGGDRRAVDATHRGAARSIAARVQDVRQPPRRDVSSQSRPRASQAAP